MNIEATKLYFALDFSSHDDDTRKADMSAQSLFTFSILAYGAFLAALAVLVMLTGRDKGNLPSREKLCREKTLGVIMAFASLIWCARHGADIFPGEKISSYFLPLALLLAWVSYFLLDFLPARGLGALSILLAHYHLHWIFALGAPVAPLVSATCFVTGTAGIALCGRPCLLRDFFRRAAESPGFRRASTCAIFAASIVYLYAGIYHLVNG